jgi:hypothetical protein
MAGYNEGEIADLRMWAASFPNAPGASECKSWLATLEAVQGRLQAAEKVIEEANNVLFDTHAQDIEHQIECHADTLPAAFREVAIGADKALAILQVWIHERIGA